MCLFLFFCLSFLSFFLFLGKKWEKKMGKNNGESGGLPLFETYNGKKKNKKESAFLYKKQPGSFSTHRTHLWTILRVDIKKEEEKRTLGNERRKPT